MEKHAMALGYYFLSAFCLFACGHAAIPLREPLLWAGWGAALMGFVFFVSACAPRLLAIKKGVTDWFVGVVALVPLARELPSYRSALRDDVQLSGVDRSGDE